MFDIFSFLLVNSSESLAEVINILSFMCFETCTGRIGPLCLTRFSISSLVAIKHCKEASFKYVLMKIQGRIQRTSQYDTSFSSSTTPISSLFFVECATLFFAANSCQVNVEPSFTGKIIQRA